MLLWGRLTTCVNGGGWAKAPTWPGASGTDRGRDRFLLSSTLHTMFIHRREADGVWTRRALTGLGGGMRVDRLDTYPNLGRSGAGRVRPRPIPTWDGQGSSTEEPRASEEEEDDRRDAVGGSRMFVDDIGMLAIPELSIDLILEPEPRHSRYHSCF